jgi:hypothetical protein
MSAGLGIGVLAQLLGRALEPLLVARHQQDARALGDQLLGNGAADSARATADEKALLLEVEVHRLAASTRAAKASISSAPSSAPSSRS